MNGPRASGGPGDGSWLRAPEVPAPVPAARVADVGRGEVGRPVGVLGQLLALVRPQFRVDVFIVQSDDPVFGGPGCTVPGCVRVARVKVLCGMHFQRWRKEGGPDMAGFVTSTSPVTRWQVPPPSCAVPTCGYGCIGDGLCRPHGRAWSSAGRPLLETWLAGAAVRVPRNGTCRVPWCRLWAVRGVALCNSHLARWHALADPDLERFAAGLRLPDDVGDHIDLSVLAPGLRLEMQYVLQERYDERHSPLPPSVVERGCRLLAAGPMDSLLAFPAAQWQQWLLACGANEVVAPFLNHARAKLLALQEGSGWEVEYPRHVWRLRNLGVQAHRATLRFDRIELEWLRDLVKRWVRWRLGTGTSLSHIATGLGAVTRFGRYLSSPAVDCTEPWQVDRDVLEGYLAVLRADLEGNTGAQTRAVSGLNTFIADARRHRWEPVLPAGAVIYAEDFPAPTVRLPRALAEHVMAQLEDPVNLARWPDPACRLITLVLMRCGLRINDATRLLPDCVVRGQDGAAYLRYVNHKMRREALVPIEEDLADEIAAQVRRNHIGWDGGTAVLFPQKQANLSGERSMNCSSYRTKLYQWMKDCDVRDEYGRPARLTPHQWRHTLGTRLINRDVPQEVVRRILDHESPQMTAHYARLSDATVRRHWQAARAVDATGKTVTLDPALQASAIGPALDGPMAEAVWARERLSRAAQALPNGFCGLPRHSSCPHANACLTCPMFLTTSEFLPQHHHHKQATLQIITRAQAEGHTRLVEMNQQVAHNLDRIITALQVEQQPCADAP